MTQTLKNAVAAALITAILTVPLLGLQLRLDGYHVVLHPHWRPVYIAVIAVFLFQLCKPMLQRAGAGIKLPAMPQLKPAQQRNALLVLLLIGLVWPFFGSRGAVDIATLAMIYVILGLGLNIVVGFAACSIWATWVSMRWAVTPTRCSTSISV